MVELTQQQRQELTQPEPTFVDPTSREEFVLVRKEVYERLKGLLYDGGEWSVAELRLQLARSSLANGWEEPGMDDYDKYDEVRGKLCR